MLKNVLTLTILLSISLLSSCFDPPEGCRDPRGTNFDVTADIDCESCCKYSNLTIEVEHIFDGLSIDTFTYFKLGNDSIRIRSLIYFLSSFELHDGLDFENATSEQKHRMGVLEDGANTFKDQKLSVAKVSIAKNTSYSLSSFLYADLYQGLNFDFGIDPFFNHADMSELSSSSPLFNASDNMYINQDSGFQFLQLKIELNREDEKIYFLNGDSYIQEFLFNREFDFQYREEKTIFLTMHLTNLFENLDFSVDSDDIIIEKLNENLVNSIEMAN